MNNFILISVKNNIKRFFSKCNKYNIELYDIRYIDSLYNKTMKNLSAALQVFGSADTKNKQL